ncbi:glycosyltransferase family 2 protein [Providencia stuartii]|uniref:glycosyltransferase family 2 protein n=3 Tax=Morganellaceae TaxID=1903414 RepID=UPI0034E5BD36
MSSFKVSVIVPVYNAENYIESALSSLLMQSLDDIEIIIINDGSTDNSLSLIKKLLDRNVNGKKHITLISRENKGVAATRNQGLKIAQGDYIIHFDSDDWVDKNWLKILYEKAIEDNSDIVICDYYSVYNKKKIYTQQQVHSSILENIKLLLVGKISNMNWDKLVRRTIITENNIQYIENINMGEDFLLTLMSFFYSHKISHVSKGLYYYNKTNQNSLTFKYSEKSLNDITKITNIAEDFFIRNNYFNNIRKEFDYFKLGVRNFFIVHSNGSLKIIMRGLNLYPETNYLVKNSNSPRMLRLIFTVSEKGFLFLCKPICLLYLVYHKIRSNS